ncbi:unnamed protein product [Trichogramma brassicae]|uniref:Uncharacterized protein n=1 Tax=Trichogramma brassicae TaxID=86971 RepID=A0A6H5I1Q8_9HYME|nr:unnamed protein product [Trichogramma brassicae]
MGIGSRWTSSGRHSRGSAAPNGGRVDSAARPRRRRLRRRLQPHDHELLDRVAHRESVPGHPGGRPRRGRPDAGTPSAEHAPGLSHRHRGPLELDRLASLLLPRGQRGPADDRRGDPWRPRRPRHRRHGAPAAQSLLRPETVADHRDVLQRSGLLRRAGARLQSQPAGAATAHGQHGQARAAGLQRGGRVEPRARHRLHHRREDTGARRTGRQGSADFHTENVAQHLREQRTKSWPIVDPRDGRRRDRRRRLVLALRSTILDLVLWCTTTQCKFSRRQYRVDRTERSKVNKKYTSFLNCKRLCFV